jgi:hypothetical protein
MKNPQIPPQPQNGTHQERFVDLARKVVSTSVDDYRKHAAEEKADRGKKKPKQST